MTSIIEFLDDQTSKNTRTTYQASLIKYFSFIYDDFPAGRRVTPDEVRHYNELSEQYLDEERDCADDLKKFARWTRERGYSKLSADQYVGVVITWLSENDVELTKKERKRIKKQQPDTGRAHEEIITADVIKQILAHSDVRLAAILAILATSGLRISEVLQLVPDDVDLESDPVRIDVPDTYTKNRQGFTTFISSEARGCLLEWLRVRDQYVESGMRRGNGLARAGVGALKRSDDERIFPYSRSTIEDSFTNTLRRAGLDETNQNTLITRHVYRIHGLRKFFLSNASRYNREIAETLANHSGYLSGSYRRHDVETLAEEYRKIEPYLLIQVPQEYRKLDERVREYGDDISHLRTKNERLEDEIAEMRKTIETLVNYTRDRGAEIDEWRSRAEALREHARLFEADVLAEAEAERLTRGTE